MYAIPFCTFQRISLYVHIVWNSVKIFYILYLIHLISYKSYMTRFIFYIHTLEPFFPNLCFLHKCNKWLVINPPKLLCAMIIHQCKKLLCPQKVNNISQLSLLHQVCPKEKHKGGNLFCAGIGYKGSTSFSQGNTHEENSLS